MHYNKGTKKDKIHHLVATNNNETENMMPMLSISQVQGRQIQQLKRRIDFD